MDAAGTLYVADTANNRVLVFWSAWDDPVPDVVLGQTSMTTNAPGSGWNQLRAPEGVFFDAATGALWVADTGNNRVLKAIGGGGGASSRTMSGPRGVQIDWAGGLYVADTGFSRVLRFAPPLSSGMAASIVFGHGGNMSNGSANLGGSDCSVCRYVEPRCAHCLKIRRGYRSASRDGTCNHTRRTHRPCKRRASDRRAAQIRQGARRGGSPGASCCD